MKQLLLALLLVVSAQAQPLLRNQFTTNTLGMTTGAVVIQGTTPLGVNNTDTNTFLRSGGVGSAPSFVALPGSSATNPIANIYVTNLFATNITVQNNLTVSNLFTVNGNHNTLIVTNSLTLQTIKTNVLATTSSGLITNVNYGSGLTWTPSTLTLSASAGAGVSTAVTTLTYSGTNIAGADMSTNGMSFFLLLTNHCLLGTSTFSNLPAKTSYQTYTFCFQQDSTGGYVPKLTNSIWNWADGNQPVIKTNAGAVSYIYAHTSLATNSMLVGTPNINIW